MDEIRKTAVGSGKMWLGFNDFEIYKKFVKNSDGAELSYSEWVVMRPWRTYSGLYRCPYVTLVRLYGAPRLIDQYSQKTR